MPAQYSHYGLPFARSSLFQYMLMGSNVNNDISKNSPTLSVARKDSEGDHFLVIKLSNERQLLDRFTGLAEKQ